MSIQSIQAILARVKRFPEPVPPLKRRASEPELRELSARTKSILVALAVMKTKCWSN